MYFSLINPYDISLRITLWPLYSQSALADIYKDATAEISFNVDGSTEETVKFVGVNVRKDGYFLVQSEALQQYTNQTLKLNTSGGMFGGKLLYVEPYYNLAVIKCENLSQKSEIKLPFVKIATNLAAQNVVGINSAFEPYFGAIAWQNPFCAYSLSEDGNYVASVYQNCQNLNINSKFTSGLILSKNGQFLGFGNTNAYTLQADKFEGKIVVSAGEINSLLGDIVEAYQSEKTFECALLDAFDCIDSQQLSCHLAVSSSDYGMENKFYHNGQLMDYSEDLLKFNQLQTESGLFLLSDFNYANAKIAKNSLISSIRVGKTKFVPKNSRDFAGIIHQISKGQTVEIEYTNVYEANLKTIAFKA